MLGVMGVKSLSGARWRGATAVVTGSSAGIGRETAMLFAALGADIVLHGRNEEKLAGVAVSVEQFGVRCLRVAGDISDPRTSEQLADAAAQLGGCSILINNAGMSMRGAFSSIAPEVFSNVCETNIVGSSLSTQALLPQIVASRGSIVFVSSVSGMTGFPGISIYAAAKMALAGLAEALRGELRGSGVHVGVIYLGFTENDSDKQILSADGSKITLSRKADMSQAETAFAIERMVAKRRERVVLTAKGHLLSLVSRISPRLVSAIIRRSGGRFHQMRNGGSNEVTP